MAEAAACDAERARGGPVRGLLHGLPISVKDQLDMAGCDLIRVRVRVGLRVRVTVTVRVRG